MPRFTMTALRAAAIFVASFAFPSGPTTAQTNLTMSSWVSPTHPLTKNVVVAWGEQVEKATNSRVKPQTTPNHPSAPPGPFDAVTDGLVAASYVPATYPPARPVPPLLPELSGGGVTAEINSIAYSRIHWKYLHQAGEYKGVKL